MLESKSAISPKTTKLIKTTIAILFLLIFLGLVSYISYNLGKEAGKKVNSTNQNTNTTSNNSVPKPEDDPVSKDKHSPSPQSESPEVDEDYDNVDWNLYEGLKNIKYPSAWRFNSNDDNPLYYEYSTTSKNGYSVIFSSYEGNYGHVCLYNDTDTDTENYLEVFQVITPKEFENYQEFEMEGNKYRYAPSDQDEHTFTVCQYDQNTGYYRSFFEGFQVEFVLPTPKADPQKMTILKEILNSAIQLN